MVTDDLGIRIKLYLVDRETSRTHWIRAPPSSLSQGRFQWSSAPEGRRTHHPDLRVKDMIVSLSADEPKSPELIMESFVNRKSDSFPVPCSEKSVPEIDFNIESFSTAVAIPISNKDNREVDLDARPDLETSASPVSIIAYAIDHSSITDPDPQLQLVGPFWIIILSTMIFLTVLCYAA